MHVIGEFERVSTWDPIPQAEEMIPPCAAEKVPDAVHYESNDSCVMLLG